MANPVFIQQAPAEPIPGPTTGGTIAVAYTTFNLTAGSVLAAIATWGAVDCTPTCADPTNGAWSAGPKLWDSTNSQGFALFYKANNTSTAKPTVTVTLTGGTDKTYRGIHISEIGPADTTQPDVAAPAWRTQDSPATTTDLVASNAIVPVTDNALIYGATCDDNGVAQAVAGTGYNSRASWTTYVPARVEDKTLASHASTTATFTAGNTGTRANTGVMAFRPVAGAPVTGGNAVPILMELRRGLR